MIKKIGSVFWYIGSAIWGAILFYLCLFLLAFLIVEGIYWYHQWKTGDEVIVSVVDSGINEKHPDFKGKVIYPYDILGWDKHPEDKHGHGTHMASVIAQISPESKVMPVKLLGKDGESNPIFNTSVSLLYSILRGADVVNMSFSEPPDVLTKYVIKYGQMHGVIFVSSAGNEGKNNVSYPAKVKGVISVAGVDEDGHLFLDSNIGKKTVFAAPAVNILGANHKWRKSSEVEVYIEKTGTSVSAAFVSGIIAYLLEQHPDWTQSEIEDELLRFSEGIQEFPKRPTKQLHSIQLKKIKAFYEKEMYLTIKAETKTTKESKTMITADVLHAKDISIIDASGHQTLPAKDGMKIAVHLKEGYNKIDAKINENNEGIIETLYLLKDTSPPNMYDWDSSEIDGKGHHYIWIEDYSISNIKVNGENAMGYLEYFHSIKKYELNEYILMLPDTHKQVKIEAEDGLGNQSTLVINELK